MLFHGISGGHIQGIMEEMERRSKTESRLAKGGQMNGRETVRKQPALPEGGSLRAWARTGQFGLGEGSLPAPVLPCPCPACAAPTLLLQRRALRVPGSVSRLFHNCCRVCFLE